MKIAFLISLLISAHIVGAQKKQWLSLYAGVNSSATVEDITKENNKWALGVFTSAYVNTGGWLRPAFEITGDVFPEDEEVHISDCCDGEYPRIDAIVSLMGGAAIQFERFLSVGAVAGPAFLKSDGTRTAFTTNKRFWVTKPFIDVTPGNGKVTMRLGYLKTNTGRFKPGFRPHYRAFTLGVGIRLLGK
jgi:hypothetical protein